MSISQSKQPSRPVWSAESLPAAMFLNMEDSMVVGWRLLAECDFVSQVVLTLVDPISSGRLRQPCRSFYCKHAQCFEYSSFVSTNRRKVLSEYQCPICLAPANPSKVYCDALWLYILHQFPSANAVTLNRSGIIQPYQNEGNHHTNNVIDLTGDDDDDEDQAPSANLGSSQSSSAKTLDIKDLVRKSDILYQLVRGLQQPLELTDFNKLTLVNMWDLLNLVNQKDPLEEIISYLPSSEKRLKKHFTKLPLTKPYLCSSIDSLKADLHLKLKVSYNDAKLMVDKITIRQKAMLSEVYHSFERYRNEANTNWNSTTTISQHTNGGLTLSNSVNCVESSSAVVNAHTRILAARSIPMKNEEVSSSADQNNSSTEIIANSAPTSSSSRDSMSSGLKQASQSVWQEEDFSNYLDRFPLRNGQSNPSQVQRNVPPNNVTNGNARQLPSLQSILSTSSSPQLNRSIPHIRQFHGTSVAAAAAPEPPIMTSTKTVIQQVQQRKEMGANSSSQTSGRHTAHVSSAIAAAPPADDLALPSSSMNNTPPLFQMVPRIEHIAASPILDSITPTPYSAHQLQSLQSLPSISSSPQLNNQATSVLQQIKDGWNFLHNNDINKLFLVQVTDPRYSEIIPVPQQRWLGLLRFNAREGKYSDFKSFQRDADLIFENCIKFYGVDSDIGQYAMNLQRLFDRHCQGVSHQESSAVPAPSDILKELLFHGVSAAEAQVTAHTTIAMPLMPHVQQVKETGASSSSQIKQTASAALPTNGLALPSSAMDDSPSTLLTMAPSIEHISASPILDLSAPTPSSTRKRSHAQIEGSDELQDILDGCGVSFSRPSLSRRISTSNSKTPNTVQPSQARSLAAASSVPHTQQPELAAPNKESVTPVNDRLRSDSASSQSSDLKSISSAENHPATQDNTELRFSQAITEPMIESCPVNSPFIEAAPVQQQQQVNPPFQAPATDLYGQKADKDDDISDSESGSSSIVFLNFVRAKRPADVVPANLKTEAAPATPTEISKIATASDQRPMEVAPVTVPLVQQLNTYQPLPAYSNPSSHSSTLSSASNGPSATSYHSQSKKRPSDSIEYSSSSSSLPPSKMVRASYQQQSSAQQEIARQQSSKPQQQQVPVLNRQLYMPLHPQPQSGAPRHPPPRPPQSQQFSTTNGGNHVHNNPAVRPPNNSQLLQYGKVLSQQRGGTRGPERLRLFAPPRAEPMPKFTDDDVMSASSQSQPEPQLAVRPIYVQRQRQTPPKPPVAHSVTQPSQQQNGPQTAHVRLMVNDFLE